MLNPAQKEWLQQLGAVVGVGDGNASSNAGPAPSEVDEATATLPRPMAADCKVVRGKVPGPAHHVLCETHNHVLDVKAGLVIAASVEDYSKRFAAPVRKSVAAAAPPLAGPRAPAASATPEPVAGLTPAQTAAPTGADFAAVTARRKHLIARIGRAKGNVDAALARYEDQKKISGDQWIISGLSRAAKEVTSLGAFDDPGPALNGILGQVRTAARSAIGVLNVDDFDSAEGICADLDLLATQAEKLALAYCEGLIDGAETAKTTVKVIDTGAKVVGGVALTVATGGAAAGVIAAEVGTATAISVAGGVAASTAGVATKLALGDKVDWGLFSIDILMQGLLARFGGKLTEGIAGAIAQRLGPMASTLGGAVIKNAAAQAVMHVDTTLFKAVLETAYQKLAGRELTLQQVYDSCIDQLTDPSSLVVLAATSAAQGHGDARAAAASGSAAPALPAASAPALSEPSASAVPVAAAAATAVPVLTPEPMPSVSVAEFKMGLEIASAAAVAPVEGKGVAAGLEAAGTAGPKAVAEGPGRAEAPVAAEGTLPVDAPVATERTLPMDAPVAAKAAEAVEGGGSGALLPEGLRMPARKSAAAKWKFIQEHVDLLTKGRRAQLDALDGEMPAQNQLAAWETQIEKSLRDAQSRAVEQGLGLPEGSVSTQKRPRGGPRAGGFEHEKTMAGIAGEQPSDVTHTLRTAGDQAQFDSLGPPGGKPQPKEYKSHATPPDEYQRPRRAPQDTYEEMQRANVEAADGAHERLAREENLDFQAKEFADQMERQARIVKDLKLPPVEWPMHSQRVQDYFETQVLPLVPKALRGRIRLVAEHYFD